MVYINNRKKLYTDSVVPLIYNTCVTVMHSLNVQYWNAGSVGGGGGGPPPEKHVVRGTSAGKF